jgi:exosortase/archaeosortase family protein
MSINKQQIRFVILLIGIYLLLYYFCIFWISLCSEGGLYWEFAEKHLNFIKWYRELLIAGSELIGELFGLKTISNSTQMRVIGRGGIRIVYSCIGYGILSLLVALAISAPHKSIKERIIFMVSSTVIFTLFNMLRLFLVAYYTVEAKRLSIDHHDIFNGICYLLIFAYMYWWIGKNLIVTNK